MKSIILTAAICAGTSALSPKEVQRPVVDARETISRPAGNRVIPANAGQWIRGDAKALAKKYPPCVPDPPR